MKKPRKPMKRTELKRGDKPLERKTELKRTWWNRGTREPKAKPNGPVKTRKPAKPGESAAERAARAFVWGRASRETGEPLCEVCGERLASEYQHRKAKAHCTRAERWAPANGLAVCGCGNLTGCHGRIHQNPTEAYANGWSVRSSHDPLKRPVLRRGVRVVFDNDGGFAPHPRQNEEAA